MGDHYAAVAHYEGTGRGSKPTGYISSATYVGEVVKSSLDSVTYKVIYEGTQIPPVPPSMLPWIFLGISIILLIGLAIIMYIYRNNTKVYGLLNGRYRIVKRQRLSYVSPTIDLTAVCLHVTCDDYIIAIDRLAVRNLHSQLVRILCEDGTVINRKIVNDGNACKLHISAVAEEESECEE